MAGFTFIQPDVGGLLSPADHGSLTGLGEDDHPHYDLRPIIITSYANRPSLPYIGQRIIANYGNYNNQVFEYDSIRSKWLSVAEYFIGFGKNNSTNDTTRNENIRHSGNTVNTRTGYLMSLPFTLTKIVIKCSRVITNTTRRDLGIRYGTTGVATLLHNIVNPISTANPNYINNNLNVDINFDNYINMRARGQSSTTLFDQWQNTVITLWIRVRLA